jgi:spore coat polysaccharide biosynthesis protein SpsF
MKIVNIIQCRSGSYRLPEKCFLKFGEATMIQRIYALISTLNYTMDNNIVTTTVVAIPENDTKLYDHLLESKIPFFVGSPTNVLDRFYRCAKFMNADYIGRITGDCPCPDLKCISYFITAIIISAKKLDYISNFRSEKRYIVDGEDYEIMSMKMLECLHKNVTSDYDKEHVTSYIHNPKNDEILKNFQRNSTYNTYDYSYIKTSIDTIEDYDRVLKHAIL